jgi:hypothetical protein
MLMGAILIKIPGFSYNILILIGITSATLVAATMYILARSSGCSQIPASMATACLTLNPIFLANAPSFMSDIPSLLLLLVALLALIRSVDIDEDRVRLNSAGLLISVVLAFIAGANRQINWVAYLGTLSALGILAPGLRRLVAGAALLLLAGAVPLELWFQRQPCTFPMHLSAGLSHAIERPLFFLLSTYKMANMQGLIMLPVAISAMCPAYWRSRPFRLAAVALLLPTLLPVDTPFSIWQSRYSLPGCGQYFTSSGVLVAGIDFTVDGISSDPRPEVLPGTVTRVMVVAGVIGLACATLCVARRLRRFRQCGARAIDTSRVPAVALAASSVAQLVAMVPWLGHGLYFDRYLLPLLPGPLILLAASRNERKCRAVAGLGWLMVGAMWVLALCFLHDYMSYNRASALLLRSLLTRGIPAVEIDGGFELNAETQLRQEGRINHPSLKNPPYRPEAKGRFIRAIPDRFPSIDARYRLTSESNPNPVEVWPEPISKVNYSTVLPPRHRAVYAYRIRRDPNP